jgi:hypothetical protein
MYRDISEVSGKSPFITDCVVADAVLVELVSTPKFAANREKNREFCEIAVSGVAEGRK